jgi:phage terminase small subunit
MNDWEKAEQDYLAGMKYKDIAEKYNVSINTVKSWKVRYKWTRNKGAPKTTKSVQKGVHTKTKKYAHKNEPDSDELTPQQELFAQLVGGKQIPLYRAYLTAYSQRKPSLATAMSEGSRLAGSSKIKERISKISQDSASHHDLSLDNVVNDYVFLRDESKASIVADGIHKANTDAFTKSLDSLARLLKLDPIIAEEYRNKKADADVNEFDAKQQLHPEDIDNGAGDSYINAIDQGIHQIFKKEDGDSE